MAERIPISLLLGGRAPDTVQPAEPGLPPLPPGPAGPPGGPETEEVVRKLVLALLEIPEIRMLIQEELMRRQEGLGPARPLPEEPLGPPRPSGAPAAPRRSFADKLAELRARS